MDRDAQQVSKPSRRYQTTQNARGAPKRWEAVRKAVKLVVVLAFHSFWERPQAFPYVLALDGKDALFTVS